MQMESVMFSALVDLPWWGMAMVALLLTHITIASVTIFLRRQLERTRLAEVLPKSHALQTMYSIRRELAAVWGRSSASREQLVKQLQEWCRRAESSGIASLVEFSQRLRSYA